MLRAYKYRLYPTEDQRVFLAQQFGNVRKVYNLALDMRGIFYNGCGQSVSRFDTQSQLIGWKEMYPYLALSNSQSLQYAVKRTAVCANRVKAFTRLSIEPEGLRLSTSDIYISADAEETVPARIPEGESVDLVLDTSHLLRALNAVRTDDVRILFSEPTRPLLITETAGEDGDDTVRCVIAPSREMEGMPVGKKKKKSAER